MIWSVKLYEVLYGVYRDDPKLENYMNAAIDGYWVVRIVSSSVKLFISVRCCYLNTFVMHNASDLRTKVVTCKALKRRACGKYARMNFSIKVL